MTVENIDVSATLEKVKGLLKEEENLSPAFKAGVELLMLVVSLLVNQLGRNSKNSSLPPSQDPHRQRKSKSKGDRRKPGGQKGHQGSTLQKIEHPHRIEEIEIDRRTIPAETYTKVGYESRQVFDVAIDLCVTEYRAEILEDTSGVQYVAHFPAGITKATQYGGEVRSQSVYMSQFQLIPLARVQDYFSDQVGLPISTGSISNFNQEAFEKLAPFEAWARKALAAAPLIHADETGINVAGQGIWLHNLSNDKVTLYHADWKRGKEAMDQMGVLAHYRGYLVHDHWKSYYRYKNCLHCLCNAHHLRELERASTEDHQKWAESLQDLLVEMNRAVDAAGGVLTSKQQTQYQKRYRNLLKQGAGECPRPLPKESGKRGRQKKSKSQNLLERLRDFEADTLRFMSVAIVPFTNNQGENDLRMTKVQQKISGCFRSMEGARIFCRIRSFLSTCRKNNVSPTDALRLLFQDKFPAFMSE
jgi:transposase